MKLIKKLLRLLLVVLIIVVLVVIGKKLVHRKQQELAKAPVYGARPVMVRVVKAKQGALQEKLDYLAVVEPFQVAKVSARLVSTVEKVLCDEGDWVKAGQILLQLDSREIQDGIAGLQAQIEQVSAEKQANDATVKALVESVGYWDRQAKRDKALADKGSIPPAQAEGTADKASTFRGQLNAARAKGKALEHTIKALGKQKDQLITKLSYCVIRSPYDGVVQNRLVDPGDLASPGKALLIVEDRSKLKLAFDVPQKDLSQIREGLKVLYKPSVNIDSPGSTTNSLRAKGQVGYQNTSIKQASLSHLFPSLNNARMLRAEVYLSGQQIKGISCGEYIPVSVITRTLPRAVLVPMSSLIEGPDNSQHLFVVSNDILLPQKVAIVAKSGDMVAVKAVANGTLKGSLTGSSAGSTATEGGNKQVGKQSPGMGTQVPAVGLQARNQSELPITEIKAGTEVVTSTFLGWARLASGQKVEVLR